MVNVLVIHDEPILGPLIASELEKYEDIHAELLSSPGDIVSRVDGGLNDIDVIILHKDYGQYREDPMPPTSGIITEHIHLANDRTRIIVVSGEYPNGEKHVLSMEADGYCTPLVILKDWGLKQIRNGRVNDTELTQRGIKVAMPTGSSFLERRRY